MANKLIYDVGMNNGDDAAYYLHRGYRVIAVEANPKLVEVAKERFRSEIAAGRLIIKNVGIAETEGDLPFWVCETHSEWSSFHRRIASRDESPHYQITVPCIRFRSVLQEHGAPHYLKIDIEGHDILCLKDLTAETAPEYISVEASQIELLDLLYGLGYDHFKCISQFHFLPLEVPPSSAQIRYEQYVRENKSLNEFRAWNGWEFSWGSSGPFGEDLPGKWLTFDEMKQTYAHFQMLQRNDEVTPFWNEKGYSFWSDFHAMNNRKHNS